MLYLGTALKSTAVTHALTVPGLLSPPSISGTVGADGPPALVVAKGNTLEVHEPRDEGLVKVAETEVWGMIVGLEWVEGREGLGPSVVVMTDHPLARLLLYTIALEGSAPSLRLTATHQLTRISARAAEHFTGLVADRSTGVVVASLYTGLLVVTEVGAGAAGDAAAASGQGQAVERRASEAQGKGKRKASLNVGAQIAGSAIAEEGEGEVDMIPVFKEVYEINIREHNLLSLAFLRSRSARRRSSTAGAPASTPRRLSMSTAGGTAPSSRSKDPTLLFLYLTPKFTTHLLPRRLSRTKKAFEDLAPPVDLLENPRFLVPSARRLVGLPGGVAVIGDQWTAEYEMGWVAAASRDSLSGEGSSARRPSQGASGSGSTPRRKSVGASTSGQDSALSRSPEAIRSTPENKRRKGSVGGSLVPTVGESREPVFTVREGWRVSQGFGEVTTATAIVGQDGTSVILMGDDMGRLSMITYDASRGKRGGARAVLLGITPAATAICHLDGPFVFLASQTGDSQLVSLASSVASGSAEDDDMDIDEAGAQDGISILDAWSNIGPVNDFVLVQDEGGASAQIVTASGATSSGSLRTIRSGLGLEDILTVDGISGVDSLYTMVSKGLGRSIIIASTPAASQAFFIGSVVDSIAFDAVALAGLDATRRTLAASVLHDRLAIVCNPLGFTVTDLASGKAVSAWADQAATAEVVLAACAGDRVVLAFGGGSIRSFGVAADGSVSAISQLDLSAQGKQCEVSAIDCGLAECGDTKIRLAVYGTWGSNTVGLANVDTGEVQESVQEIAHVSSIRIRNGSEVLVGLGNGCLVSYDLVPPAKPGGLPVLSGRKQLSLGVEPVILSASGSELQVEGSRQIVSLGQRISVIHRERGRVMASSTSGKDTTAVTTLSAPTLGSCLISAVNDSIVVQRVTGLKELQMRKFDLGYDQPVAIAYHAALKVYGVAINRTTMDSFTGNEQQRSMFRLFDAGSFRPLAEIELPVTHEILSLNLIHLQGKILFSIGTVKAVPAGIVGQDPSGHITLVEAKMDGDHDAYKLDTLVAEEVGGPVYDSKAIWDCLVIAVDNRAELYAFDPIDHSINLLSSWGNAFYASCLTVQDLPDGKQRLHVADGMRSVFAFERGSNGDLLDVGRDIKPHWILKMEELDSEGGAVIFADTSFNLLTIRHKDNKLENAAGIALHETPGRFRRGAMTPSYANTSAVRPEVLFATTSGALGVIADIGEDESKILSDLQRNMDEVVTGPGISWRAYREVHTEGSGKPRGTLGFIDGDYVKRFLDVPTSAAPVTASRILDGTNEFERVGLGVGKAGGPADLDQVYGVLETVTALH